MRVLIAVTHLLGTGHLARALTLARAFAAAGHHAVVVSGGMAAPHLDHAGVEIVQLPALRSDGTDFTRLLDGRGAPAEAGLLARRRARLVAALRERVPDILITELYPFGRRVLSDEFLALLEAAHELAPRPVVLSSIRDILAPPSTPAKAARADEIVARYYDSVLVHSDPAITRLDASWPVSTRLAGRLHHTGYVAPPPAGPHPEAAGTGEILVSAGGGEVGTALFRCAVEAARRLPERRWRLLVGGADDARRDALRRQAAGTATLVEPARRDFRQMLHHAAASVSMCGYNTAIDLLQAGLPAVIVPFDAGNEVEQTLRGQSLARLSGIALLRGAELTPDRLAATVRRTIETGTGNRPPPVFDGAAETVRFATAMAGRRR